MKRAMYKVIGNATLRWRELKEVILDVEVCLNNQPLTYVEDDVQEPVLTPNLMINGQDYPYPEDDEEMTDKEDLKRRVRYLKSCKDRLWKRWTGEYVRGLRERHNQKHNQKQMGEVVLVHGDGKNRGKWTIGMVQRVFEGCDGVVRGVELKTPKMNLDRPVQLLYPLELKVSVDPAPEIMRPLNPQVQEFRPRRRAAETT